MIYSIGHSTRSADELLALLQLHRIERLADVRTMPMSRRHPQFNRDALDGFLHDHGIGYLHMPGLGGLRKPRPDSNNTGWKHASFRGYADYMETGAFQAALDDLRRFATVPTAVMCAEAVWWKCHRRLLADALLARGVPVRHIVGSAPPEVHELSDFGRIEAGKVTYPALLSPPVGNGPTLA